MVETKTVFHDSSAREDLELGPSVGCPSRQGNHRTRSTAFLQPAVITEQQKAFPFFRREQAAFDAKRLASPFEPRIPRLNWLSFC